MNRRGLHWRGEISPEEIVLIDVHGEVLAERHPVERTALIHPRRDASRDQRARRRRPRSTATRRPTSKVLKMATVKLNSPHDFSYPATCCRLKPSSPVLGASPEDADLPNSTNNCSDASY